MNKVLAVLLATAMPVVAHGAQWLNYPDSRTPRTKDGKPNLAAPTPRVQGKPDLSGVWQAERTSEQEFVAALGKDFAQLQIDPQDFTKNVFNVFWGLPPEAEPLRPAGIATYKRHQETRLSIPIRNVSRTACPRTCSCWLSSCSRCPRRL